MSHAFHHSSFELLINVADLLVEFHVCPGSSSCIKYLPARVFPLKHGFANSKGMHALQREDASFFLLPLRTLYVNTMLWLDNSLEAKIFSSTVPRGGRQRKTRKVAADQTFIHDSGLREVLPKFGCIYYALICTLSSPHVSFLIIACVCHILGYAESSLSLLGRIKGCTNYCPNCGRNGCMRVAV